MSIANVSIVGNLVKAPQQTQFASGKVKTTMFVAVNSPMKKTKDGNTTADFYKVETWGKLAELAASKLDKGNQVAANGRLSMETWVDKQGRDRITPTISVYDFAFPPRPRTEQSFSSRNQEPFEASDAVIEHVFGATNCGGAVNSPARCDGGDQFVAGECPIAAADGPIEGAADDSVAAAGQPAAASDDDEEFDEAEVEESDNSDDDFGMPNTSTRPAPTRDGRASPR